MLSIIVTDKYYLFSKECYNNYFFKTLTQYCIFIKIILSHNIYTNMSGAYTPGTVPTAPYGWNNQTSVPPASPYTPQPDFVKAPYELITTVVPVGPHSTRTVCSNCRQEITTNVTKKPSSMAYLSSFLCCVVGCFWGPCLIPFCMDQCLTVEHECPKCESYIGRYQR